MKEKIKKERIDRLLITLGLVSEPHLAEALLMAGRIKVDGEVVTKAGQLVKINSEIILKEGQKYVSRGGLKLEGALKDLDINVDGFSTLDAGSSTGGFTDCLLKSGALSVFAVDVGRGLIDLRLREDSRVTLLENKNIRYLTTADINEKFELITVDLSFISLKKVLATLKNFLKINGRMLTLVKPQFEVERAQVGKGGIVRDKALHRLVLEELKVFAKGLGFDILGEAKSQLTGTKGNVEFWLYLGT
ncbi:MAG: TlyA family RNA methyltransferase [Deltaproteobacteria bacterium]|nr:TlyA family RNA methyltransferase [Deltaproteobacteria bacterium]